MTTTETCAGEGVGLVTTEKPNPWRSRPFGDTSTRGLIAEELARYERHDDIPPGVWALAGRVEKRLRAEGRLVDLRLKKKES